jgi:hypothetical protein
VKFLVIGCVLSQKMKAKIALKTGNGRHVREPIAYKFNIENE